jgi:hypothetical protein
VSASLAVHRRLYASNFRQGSILYSRLEDVDRVNEASIPQEQPICVESGRVWLSTLRSLYNTYQIAFHSHFRHDRRNSACNLDLLVMPVFARDKNRTLRLAGGSSRLTIGTMLPSLRSWVTGPYSFSAPRHRSNGSICI